MQPTTPSPDALDAACRAWQLLLGESAVSQSPDVLAHYGRTTLPDAPRPVAVIRVQETDQVTPIVQIAATHDVPLYPISRGRNWGFGDACPPTPGQVILDLSALNRILEVHEELGYAVVEPGVTQGQLAAHLRESNSAWWLDMTAAGPGTSVLGNILERGGTREERSALVCGMQVVLADGTVLRTGYGHYPESRVTHVARSGIGPSLDGLFTQSNVGIVTSVGFWLQPKPAHAVKGFYAVPDEALEPVIDALRPLRIRGIIPGMPLQLTPVGGRSVWLGITTLSGNPGAVAAHRDELTAALAPWSTVVFPTPADAADSTARAELASAMGVPPNPFFENMLSRIEPFEMPQVSPAALLSWLGGADVQHPTEPPTSADPLDHNYGFTFVWLSCPALGREVRALLNLVRPILARYDFPELFGLRLVTGRAITLVMRLGFDRDDAERCDAVRVCEQELIEQAIGAGYPPVRTSITGMNALNPGDDTYWQVVRRLKDCLDPHHLLAPGRYLPPVGGG